MIAFIASLISDIRSDFPNFAWWAIAYMLCCIVGVLVVVASDSTQTYHVAVRRTSCDGKGFALIYDRLLDFSRQAWFLPARSLMHSFTPPMEPRKPQQQGLFFYLWSRYEFKGPGSYGAIE